jgi:ferredoxin--NADP+ reductase
MEVRLSFTKEVAGGVFLLGFRRPFEFLPGQVIGIGLSKEGPRRLYSLCSGATDENIHILYNVVDEGYLTPRLSGLKPGDTLWITGPRGEFLYQDGPGIWIATGTGIAPFYSMLRSGQFHNKLMIHGERHPDRFYFQDEFSGVFGNKYIRCCSREPAKGLFHGRVTDYLALADDLPVNSTYSLCGSAEMVVEVRDLLIGKGVRFDRIVSEIYF